VGNEKGAFGLSSIHYSVTVWRSIHRSGGLASALSGYGLSISRSAHKLSMVGPICAIAGAPDREGYTCGEAFLLDTRTWGEGVTACYWFYFLVGVCGDSEVCWGLMCLSAVEQMRFWGGGNRFFASQLFFF